MQHPLGSLAAVESTRGLNRDPSVSQKGFCHQSYLESTSEEGVKALNLL